jgi:hypothetical protein
MKIENTEVWGFFAALRSMRNPVDSWERSDTDYSNSWELGNHLLLPAATDAPAVIGPEDLKLALKLIRNGTEHRKFIRGICVWATWILPRYVWTEADTYKVGFTRMSCSTMHKLGHTNLTKDDFQDGVVLPETLAELNRLGKAYRETKSYGLVRTMKKLLPESFLQKADVFFNYEVAANMFRQRRNHRLPEWAFTDGNSGSICDWIFNLPHFEQLFLK